jgi:predicted  nucleic acid-binding Zn-ribbon protein
MSTEKRIERLESAFVQLSEMVGSTDERADQHQDWINQLGSRMEELASAQVNTEHKIAALTDAMIRVEDAQTRTEDALVRLADAQARTEKKLDALIDVVREMRGAS